jgi:hypothetical protein
LSPGRGGYRVAGFVVVTVFVCGATLLFLMHIYAYTQLRMGVGLIRVSPWATYVTGVAAIGIAALVAFVRPNMPAAAAGLLALALFCLSLRTVEFDSLTVVVAEHWAGVRLSSDELSGLNDQGYCYDPGGFVIRFRRIGTADEHSYFRGVWPSRFADADILRSADVKQCRHGA